MSSSTQVMAPAAPASEVRWRPSTRGWAARIGFLAGLALLIFLLLARAQPFWADRVALAAIYAIIGISLNVVLGYTGQVSLGHHAFVGLSAFISAYVVTESGQSFWIGLLAAVFIGIFSAGLLGLVALRIKGLYLALITLVYGFVAVNSIFEIPALTRGGAGMPAPRPSGFGTDHRYMVLCLLFLALAIFIDWRVVRSKVGRAILAVKQSDAVAASYAVNVTGYKVLGFMLSGAFAGLAGSLFAHRTTNVVSNDFQFQTALLWVLMVVVGGLGNRTGVVIGSMFFALFPFLLGLIAPLEHWIVDTLQKDPEELSLVIGPVLALFTIIMYPGGIGEQISPITRWLRGEKFSMHPDGHKPKQKGERSKTLLSRLGLHKTETPADDAAAHNGNAETEATGTMEAVSAEGSPESGNGTKEEV